MQLPAPSAAHRVCRVRRLAIRDGPFLLDRAVKLTEERDCLVRTLPISHRAGLFFVVVPAVLSFPKSLEITIVGTMKAK